MQRAYAMLFCCQKRTVNLLTCGWTNIKLSVPKGRDKYWNEHSVLVPEKLAAAYPEKITQLSPYAFHYPLYDKAGLRSMFEEVNTISRGLSSSSYGNHFPGINIYHS